MAACDASSASSGAPETGNCSDIRLLLSVYVDNEATPEEVAQARAHIAVCVDCASHLAFLRLTGRALSQAPEVFPSASLSVRIAAATYERPTLAERITGWLRPAPVRVGLGAAMATGLAMVLIMPRMGEVNTADIPSVSETVVSSPKDESASRTIPASVTPLKSVVTTAKTADAKTAGVSVSKPKTAGSVKLPAAKPAVASVQPPALSVKKPAPVVVAKSSRRQPLDSLTTSGTASLNVNDVIQHVRTEPPVNRGSTPRSAPGKTSLKPPGVVSVTMPRSGYDRNAATQNILKAQETVTSAASVVPFVPAVSASNIPPLLPENTTITERVAPRSPVASKAVPVAATIEAPPRNLRYRVNRPRNTAGESFSTAGLNRGSGGLPSASGRDSSFGFSPAVKAGIVDLPMTGTDR